MTNLGNLGSQCTRSSRIVNGLYGNATQHYVAHVQRKRKIILGRVKSKHWDRTHKHGIRVPKSVEEAYKIDEENGNSLWTDAIKDEMLKIMDDLVENKCDVLTIGQYLQPTKMHVEVAEFVHPDVFAMYKEEGLRRGFDYVESGPLVRSSYHAERHL